MLFLYIGIEFFVLQAFRSHYPRHRKLFNVLNLLLWDVPNDAEYAMEVLCLNGKEGEESRTSSRNRSSSTTSSSTTSSSSSNSASRAVVVGPPKPNVPKASASMSDLFTTARSVETINTTTAKDETKGMGFQEVASSAATTLAMLAAAAAVNKVKQTVDNKRKKKEAQSFIPPDDDPDGKKINKK